MLKASTTPEKAIVLGQNTRDKRVPETYQSMRQALLHVFPAGSSAWQNSTAVPDRNPGPWLKGLEKSHEFVQSYTPMLVALWRDLEKAQWNVNGKTLYDHQKALLAWATISGIVTGTRKEMPNLLLRSPYGSGKGLVAGIAVEAFVRLLAQEQGADTEDDALPRAALVCAKPYLLFQNAVGEEYRLRRPPYVFTDAQLRSMYDAMERLYGTDFSNVFPKPRGKASPWYDIFRTEEEDDRSAATRVNDVLRKLGQTAVKTWRTCRSSDDMFRMLTGILEGSLTIRPDTQNMPLVQQVPKRSGDTSLTNVSLRGDMGYAITRDLPVAATHRDLLPDPRTYSPKHDPDTTRLLCIASGNALFREKDRMRADIRKQIVERLRLMVVDEAGRSDPAALGDMTTQLSGTPPLILGLTAQDAGMKGWTRSPQLSLPQSVELGFAKPIGFQCIGAQDECFPAGSEGAWQQYRNQLFTEVEAAHKLKLRQPWECDRMIVVPTPLVWEYGYRLEEAYREEGVPAEVLCYDPKLGADRFALLDDFLRHPPAEQKKKRPVRMVVTGPTALSTGTNLRIDAIDLLAPVSAHDLEQLLGRLFHQRRTKTDAAERTYFRQQIFTEPKILLLRQIAEQGGFRLPDTKATWIPLRCGIDATEYKSDGKRSLGKPQPVPDAQRRKGETQEELPYQPMRLRNPYLIALEKRKLEDRPTYVSKFAVAMEVDEAGMPTSEWLLEQLRKASLTSYLNSIRLRAQDAHKMGKRDAELEFVIRQKITQLQQRCSSKSE